MARVGAKQPNKLLAAVLEEAGFSHKGFAARVRAEGTRAGLDIKTDHVAVGRWLGGMRPHDDTIRCIVAVLSNKLHRKITFADVGFEASAPGPQADPVTIDDGAQYPSKPEEAVDVLANLTSADLSDNPIVAGSSWVPDTAPSTITGYLFADPLRTDQAGPHADSGTDVAARIRATSRYMMDLDFQFGGGHVRKMLLFYWKTEIIPELEKSHPEAVQREVFSAAADAAEMLGWSAYDAGRHGASQRYFVQGLRLAREANDHLMGAQILAKLSHQANYLGNFSDAVQFARAAQSAAIGKATPAMSTLFLAMEARALASLGDARECAEVLHRAEQMFERCNPDEEPNWIKYFDYLELAGEMAHCFRDLGQAEQTQSFARKAIHPVLTPPRTKAFIGLVHAAGALTSGNLDEAVSIATETVNIAGQLQSSRYLRYVSDFFRSLAEKHAQDQAVQDFANLIQRSYPTLTLPGPVRTDANQGTARLEVFASVPDTLRQSRGTQQRSA